MNIVYKSFVLIKSIYIYFKYKLIYGNRLNMHYMNSIRGSLKIEMFKGGKCIIGNFLMSRGPLYIKVTDDAIIKIGDKCFFNNNCSITSANEISIGDNCMFANNLVIVDHDHKIVNNSITGDLVSASVTIGNNVWCGANVTILKGVTIGDGAVIGAGAVVNRDVPAHSVAVGVPIRISEIFKRKNI